MDISFANVLKVTVGDSLEMVWVRSNRAQRSSLHGKQQIKY